MISLADTLKAFETGKAQFEQLMEQLEHTAFETVHVYGGAKTPDNVLAQGDNLEYMIYLLKEKQMAGKIQLIYVDPPFFSNGKYQASVRLESEKLGASKVMKAGAYDDCWARGAAEYLEMLTVRLFLMKELLCETGCIWVHLDWHMNHYIKVILDQIFGEKNFVNEVIWTYKSGGVNKRNFAKKHDNLLLYSKSGKYVFNMLKEKSYNRGFKPYRFKGVEEFEDELGWYTMVNMKDVWQIDMVGRTSSERTGYATQKPEKLLERVIMSCSNEGDLCADFFSGSGTLGAVSEKLGRKWIMCDGGGMAVADQISRMGKLGGSFSLDAGCVQTRCSCLDVAVEDGCISLNSYVPVIPEGMEKFDDELKKYMDEDCLSFIKCWSIDPDHDGSIHRAETVLDGKQRDCMLMQKGKSNMVSISGYDVFGNSFTEIIKL